MKNVSVAAFVAATLILGHLHLTAAESARFRFLLSVYADEKGAGLSRPEGVACDSRGRLVVGDTGNDRVVRFTYENKTVSGGSEIKIPELSAPLRIQLNSKGDIYALDGKRRRIVHLGPDGDFRGALSFEGAPPPTTIVPKSFTIDAADTLYVLDVFSARILVLDAAGQFQKALALPGGTAFATDLAVDSLGNILVLDSVGRRVYAAGKDATSFTPLGGDLTASLITLPTTLVASKGVIFIVEGVGSSIVGIGRDGSFLGRQLSAGRNEGALQHPAQVCINDNDEVFVADRDNSRIQLFGMTR